MRDKVARWLSPSTTTFEERGEPKRNRTEVLLLTSLTPYCLAKPAHWSECLPWCLSSTETERLIRDGEKGEVIRGGGGGEIIYLSLHCHHQDDSCIEMGSDESHFNVSVGSGGQSHNYKTVSTNHNLFEEKGEPKRYRTEVLPLTSLTPYR